MSEETKSLGRKILDILDIGVTSVAFIVIFVTFMISIISRYVLRIPVTWTYEISILGYMWTMFFGVGKAIENDQHVVFSLVYDKVSPKTKKIFLILYNVLLVVLLLIAFIPCIQAMLKSTMTTGVLKLPYKLVFAPFFFMIIETIVLSALNIKKAVAMDLSELATPQNSETTGGEAE
ncbi:MAG: TRAP transporter small permease subunit [Lachnospiraceae bacterium]|nr:TRAP transporter small permease subunit [Lachnospiraceae bacterium]